MRSVMKLHITLAYYMVYVIYRFIQSDNIMFGNEYHIILSEISKVLTLLEHVSIYHARVVSCPLGICSFVGSLYLDIVLCTGTVGGINIKPYAAPVDIVQLFLRLNLCDLKIIPIQDYFKQQFRTFNISVKTDIHEIIVDQAECLDPP